MFPVALRQRKELEALDGANVAPSCTIGQKQPYCVGSVWVSANLYSL